MKQRLICLTKMTKMMVKGIRLKSVEPAVKHGGGRIMLWSWCIAQSG